MEKVLRRMRKRKSIILEEAAICGYPDARYILGAYEGRDERYERALKHWIIAAKLGHDGALEAVKVYFSVGLVSKDDYEAALRGHQAAVDATKSEQREEAYAVYVYVDSEA
jgi:TPR repeat protein